MGSTVKNGISLWDMKINQDKVDGSWIKQITQDPVLCPCGYTRKLGARRWEPEKTWYHKLDAIISPVDDNYSYKCINDGGKSGAEMPEWNTELNSITQDGEVMWQCIERKIASYFYHHYYYLCEGCGNMMIGDETFHDGELTGDLTGDLND